MKVFLFHVQVRRCKVRDVCLLSDILELDGSPVVQSFLLAQIDGLMTLGLYKQS